MRNSNEFLEKLSDKELLEILADLEHKRWSNWQKYVHSLCTKNADGSLTIPKERVEWWENEIETNYTDLEEKLKECDREEVRPVLKEIEKYMLQNIELMI